jgi:N-acetylglutamate synthase-like GNAT family acetyltransferase
VIFERRNGNGDVLLTTDPLRMDVGVVEAFLRQSYWANERPRERIATSIEHSLCFMLIDETADKAFGFARVVTDYADFAWLCDVWIEEAYRGRGLGDWLVAQVIEHPRLQGLRRIVLATSSAHRLYARHGFVPFAEPAMWMERKAAIMDCADRSRGSRAGR